MAIDDVFTEKDLGYPHHFKIGYIEGEMSFIPDLGKRIAEINQKNNIESTRYRIGKIVGRSKVIMAVFLTSYVFYDAYGNSSIWKY